METSEKVIDVSFKAIKFTGEMLKSVLEDLAEGKVEHTGTKSYGNLKRSGKLENIDVSKENLKEFNKTAAKYDLSYSVKKEKNSDIYHVFFKTKDTESMKRAFREYTSNTLEKATEQKAEIPRDKLKKIAQNIEQTQKREKVRERNKSKDVSL